VRRFLDARAERAAGRVRAKAARMGWRVVLAQRTPPMRAAAKRIRWLGQARYPDGRERRSLRSPSGRLTAQRLRSNTSISGSDSLLGGCSEKPCSKRGCFPSSGRVKRCM
jgi:hypothetical protein